MILRSIYDAILSRCEAAFGLLAGRRLWLAWGVALAIALSLFISLYQPVSRHRCPHLEVLTDPVTPGARPAAVTGDHYEDQSSHEPVLAFRLTLPMTTKILLLRLYDYGTAG